MSKTATKTALHEYVESLKLRHRRIESITLKPMKDGSFEGHFAMSAPNTKWWDDLKLDSNMTRIDLKAGNWNLIATQIGHLLKAVEDE